MVTPEQIKTWLTAGLPGAEIDVTGDGHHFEATVVWSEFAGSSMLQQHRRVYDALGTRMGGEIHALALKTRAN
jgi:acid stress-induced BolA-like protein IbaG/YrbA